MLAASSQDTRLLVVYGYARLVGYDRDLNLVPDILSAVEVEDGRVFTLRLREGHRWSDGAPFTTEDFRYFWEDVANNEQLSPFGPPWELLVEGEPPVVEIIDPLTVRYSWSSPNPYFLPALAGARPLFIYRPAHYLRQFHEKYADPAELARKVERGPGARLGAAARPARSHVPVRQSGSADPAAVDDADPAAGGTLRRRAQSVLSPGRRRRASSCPTSTA